MTLALALSSSVFVACGEDEQGTIKGNYEKATAQETYATLSSLNVDALSGVDPETGEAVENFRIGASLKNDLAFAATIGEESISTAVGAELKLRSWEEKDKEEPQSELSAKASVNLKASQAFSKVLYESAFSSGDNIYDAENNPITPPAIDLTASAEAYANNANAFLKLSTQGLNVYEGSVGASNQLYSASLVDSDFSWAYKFDMTELIALMMGGGAEAVNTSGAPDSSDISLEEPSLIETLGLTEELLATGETAFGLEYSLDVSKSGTKIKIATTEATMTAVNLMLLESEAPASADSSTPTELPTQFEKFDVALYVQISDNGTPVKLAASVDVKLNFYDDDMVEQYGSNKTTISLTNYLDLDFSWIKNSVLPKGIETSTDYKAVTVEEFATEAEDVLALIFGS